MKNKYFRMIIISLIIFTFFINTSNISEANEELSIYNDYVVDNLDDISRIIKITENNNLNDEIIIKNGFKFNETIIYPIMENNKLFSYLMVYCDKLNSLDWTLNGIIPEHKLNEFKIDEENIEIYNLNKILLKKSKSSSNFLEIEYNSLNINWNKMNTIRGQINSNSPIYLAGNRYEKGVKKGRHAFVLSGYDVGSNKAYVWNPWGSYTWFSVSTKSIPAGSFTYKWDLSITGWSK